IWEFGCWTIQPQRKGSGMSANKAKTAKTPRGKKHAAKPAKEGKKQNTKRTLSVDTILSTMTEEGHSSVDVGVDELIEPDESLLPPEEEIEEVLTLHIRETSEMAEDPVRLYLREIGQVKLLAADSEFRLATLIEADRLIGTLQKLKQRRGTSPASSVYHSLISEMLTSWDRLIEDADRIDQELPNLALLVAEAQSLHAGWEFDSPSYLRAFLDNGNWGVDHLWDNLARHAYSVYLSLYL